MKRAYFGELCLPFVSEIGGLDEFSHDVTTFTRKTTKKYTVIKSKNITRDFTATGIIRDDSEVWTVIQHLFDEDYVQKTTDDYVDAINNLNGSIVMFQFDDRTENVAITDTEITNSVDDVRTFTIRGYVL